MVRRVCVVKQCVDYNAYQSVDTHPQGSTCSTLRFILPPSSFPNSSSFLLSYSSFLLPPLLPSSELSQKGLQFRNQLASLMETLSKTESLYIRCIKPNSVKKADLFDAHMCDEQLRYSGVFEAVKIRQQGYPIRLLHRRFYMRYRACATAEERGVLDHQLGTDRDRAEYLVGQAYVSKNHSYDSRSRNSQCVARLTLHRRRCS